MAVWLDDNFPEHPKLIRVGPLGLALQVAALCYSSRNMTDGFVPEDKVLGLLPLSTSVRLRTIEALLANGPLGEAPMWERVEGGYRLHDYLEHQESKAKKVKRMEDNREAKVRSGRAGGIASSIVRSKQTPSENEANAKQTRSKVPSENEAKRSPTPYPMSQSPSETQDLRAAATARTRMEQGFAKRLLEGWDANGFPPMSSAQMQAFGQWCRDYEGRWHREPPDVMADYVLDEAMDHGARNWAYARKVMDGCLSMGAIQPKKEAGDGRGERPARAGRGAEAHGGQSDPWASAKRAAAAEPGV